MTAPPRPHPSRPSVTERAVERAARLVRQPQLTRRNLLYRAAMVGSALAVNPFDFILRPLSAYAAVCGHDASCNSGWSAFCCTINAGANTCPPGSFPAGWWKVDDSAFCRGLPRYYIDCNREAEASCRCRCAEGDCDRRRTCCNVFRYGQCNQHIGGVTEVVCRVVTCTPPWEWDPSCTTTARTDNSTATHTSTCLPGRWPSHIEIKYQDLGLAGAAVGTPTQAERPAAGDGRWRRFTNGLVLWHADTGAYALHGPIAARYDAIGREAGRLGYPLSDEVDVGDGRGRQNWFQHGAIYLTPATGAWEVVGDIAGRYTEVSGPFGPLGYPVGGDTDLGDGQGRSSDFERGAIFASAASGAWEVQGRVLERYQALGGPTGATGLGYPVAAAVGTAAGGVQQRFQGGRIQFHPDHGTRALWGAIFDRYHRLQATKGPLGHPVADQRPVEDGRGEVAEFSGGVMWWSDASGAHWLHGPVLQHYLEDGGPQGPLGYPTGDVFADRAGNHHAGFEGGAMLAERHGGQVRVVPRRDPRPQRPTATRAAAPTRLPHDR